MAAGLPRPRMLQQVGIVADDGTNGQFVLCDSSGQIYALLGASTAVIGKTQPGLASAFDHGSNRDIDTTAEQISTASYVPTWGVMLTADAANSGILYIGNSDVTAGTTDATDGTPLSAGESKTFPIDNVNKLYAIGSAANQIAYWFAV